MISTKILAVFVVLMMVAVCIHAEEMERGQQMATNEKTLIRTRRWWPWGMGMGGMGMGMWPGMMGGWGMRPFGMWGWGR